MHRFFPRILSRLNPTFILVACLLFLGLFGPDFMGAFESSAQSWQEPTLDLPPIPLPRQCDGVTPPEPHGDPPSCCAFGYVYYDDVPVSGATVQVEYLDRSYAVTTTLGEFSTYPYYSVPLSGTPLNARVGSLITLTFSYDDVSVSRTWVVARGSQQIDAGLAPASQPGDVWESVLVDDSTFVRYAKLALDTNDQPHLIYQDGTHQNLKYAYLEGTMWYSETVHRSSNTGYQPSIDVDSNGIPHAVWTDETEHSLRYGHRAGSVWQSEVVGMGTWPKNNKVVVDSHDRPHISFFADTDDSIRYIQNSGTLWYTEFVDYTQADTHANMTLDPFDQPHIAYSLLGWQQLKYAWREQVWYTQTIGSALVGPVSIAADSAGSPHLVLLDQTDHQLRYFWFDGNAWYSDTLDVTAHGLGALALDSWDNPHLSYTECDDTYCYVKYAYKTGRDWQIETIALGSGGYLALDTTDQPHLSFISPNGELWYTKKTAPSKDVILFTLGSEAGSPDTEIYMIEPDGSGLTRLTYNDWVDWMPSLSPDGRTIVFDAGTAASPGTPVFTYKMDVASREIVTLTQQPYKSELTWSPDSAELAFSHPGGINVLNLDGQIVYTVPITLSYVSWVDWSPDGDKLAVVAHPWVLYQVDLDGADLNVLSDKQPRAPDWSPDQSQITYEGYRGGLRVINSDGSDDNPLTTAQVAFLPSWSSDGSQIAYAALDAKELRIVSADGTQDYLVPNVAAGWLDGVQWGQIMAGPITPTATFSALPLSGTAPLEVTFNNESTGEINFWTWDLGDGAINGARYPSHRYTLTGTHSVSLTVAGPGGFDTEIKPDYIDVTPEPVYSQWTFMLYFASDNNLHTYLEAAIEELEERAFNSSLNILVLWDGWHDDNTCVYEIAYHPAPGIGSTCLPVLWNPGEMNTGNAQTLVEFVNWALGQHPDSYYFLSIANHGRGTTGIAWDDHSGGDNLSAYSELETAFRAFDHEIDVLYLDACLMAMIEDAVEVQDQVDYIVASENLGWSIFAYADYIAGVGANTGPVQLAEHVAETYFTQLYGYPGTVSVMDTSFLTEVSEATSDFAQALIDYMTSANVSQVKALRDNVQPFDSRNYLVLDSTDEYVDLYHLAELAQSNISDQTVRDEALDLMEAISNCVVAERHQSGTYPWSGAYWDLDDAYGISIYYPPSNGGWDYMNYVTGGSWRFANDTQWDEFLSTYFGLVGTQPETPVDPGVPPIQPVQVRVFLPLIIKP